MYQSLSANQLSVQPIQQVIHSFLTKIGHRNSYKNTFALIKLIITSDKIFVNGLIGSSTQLLDSYSTRNKSIASCLTNKRFPHRK